jgi:hypothetical protein
MSLEKFGGFTQKEHNDFMQRIKEKAEEAYSCECLKLESPHHLQDGMWIGRIIVGTELNLYYRVPDDTNFFNDPWAHVSFIREGEPNSHALHRMIAIREDENPPKVEDKKQTVTGRTKKEEETMKFSKVPLELRQLFIGKVVKYIVHHFRASSFDQTWIAENTGEIKLFDSWSNTMATIHYDVTDSPICHDLSGRQQHSVLFTHAGGPREFHKTFTLDLPSLDTEPKKKEEESLQQDEPSKVFDGLTVLEHSQFLGRIGQEAKMVYRRPGYRAVVMDPVPSAIDDFLVGHIELGNFKCYYRIPVDTNFHKHLYARVQFLEEGEPISATTERFVDIREAKKKKPRRKGKPVRKQEARKEEETMKPKYYEPTMVTVFKFQFPDGREVTSPIPEGYSPRFNKESPEERPGWCHYHVVEAALSRQQGSFRAKSAELERTFYYHHSAVRCWFADMGPILQGECARLISYQAYEAIDALE